MYKLMYTFPVPIDSEGRKHRPIDKAYIEMQLGAWVEHLTSPPAPFFPSNDVYLIEM